ncbi:hypothetical protein [Sphingobium fuliginis]|jgi:hypothetical protein|uniref:hypothetical protein n=1 Tax=Sphingobium fuliginis (strain ATCC 27551) TaxID=336203 RepID=UPI0037C65C7B
MVDRLENGQQERNSGGFNFNPDVDASNYAVHIGDTMALQSQALAEHQGRIDGLGTALQAVQSSLNFWQAAGLGLGGLILASVSVVIALQFSNAGDIKDLGKKVDAISIEKLDGRIDRMETRIDRVDAKVDALPGRISDSIRESSRDLVLITQGRRSEERRSDSD